MDTASDPGLVHHNGPVQTIIPMSVRTTAIRGLSVITMKQVTDERGTVREFYRQSAFAEAGLPDLGPFLQVNLTETGFGAIRGMHAESMSKLVAVVSGEAFGAYVDLRPESDTHRQLETVRLTPGTQVLVPEGVGNGFQSVSPQGTQYLYCFDSEWRPGMAGEAVTPLDPALAIPWPIIVDPSDPSLLSVKDASAPSIDG